TSWILIGCFSGHCGRSFISRLITLSVNPGNSTDIQTRWKTCTMKRIYCALFIIVFNHQVCAATDTKPSKGRARYSIPSGFSNNNGRFEFEITVVERVSRNGRRLSPHKHFIKYEHSGVRTGTVFYRLVAFGRTFLFRLDRDNSHLSPLLNVEHVYDRTRRLSFAGDLRHCFYRGDLQGDLNSTAVLNLCNGLRGSFVTSGERYFIEPTKEQDTNASTQFRKFHIIFRHPTERNSLSNGLATCALKDTNKPLPLLRGRHNHHANRSREGTRKRRSTDESFVETLVVADRTMVDAFKSKADLQAYILTLMGVVSQVYRDRSIGNSINIVVVKIALLESNQRGLHISSDTVRTLKSFCRWQNRVMTKPQKDPEHHDTAILLTRRNLCRRPGKCDALGLSEIGTMCSPGRSCALAEDSGLGTAYTIAHELGHVFSLPHDGDNNQCTRSRGDQRLMAPSLSFDTKPWSWSNCSRDKITQFLEFLYTLSRVEISAYAVIRIRVDARIRIFLYMLTSQYQNQSFSARDLTNPLRCPDANQIRVDGRIRFVYTTCGRRYFCIRIKKFADTKISGYVWTGPYCLLLGYGSCLEDKPLEKAELKYHDTLPGELYSVDQQCKMVFGENSSLCPFMEPCQRLWCVKMINNRRGCSTHHMPWADGTPCAKKSWCIRGQCVKKQRPKPVDGNWGVWGPYQECTRSCGGGIAFSYRECNKPL
ncbi:unnamed protein product, partial [Porites lobata]